MEEELDEKICKQMAGLVELLTTSGKPSLNPEIMKKFKKLCRTSDGYVKYAFDLLMKQVKMKHSEVRLSVYQMVDELFQRSHIFRELILEDLQTFIDFTTGLDKKKPLPPPKAVAKTMKEAVFRSIYLWHEKYGIGYKKLALGYEFLKNCKKVDFDSVQESIELERQHQEEADRKLEQARQEKLQKVTEEFSENQTDIELCITEIDNGLLLLVPKLDDFFIPLEEDGEIALSNSSNGQSTSTTTDCSSSTSTTTDCSSSQANESVTSQTANCKNKHIGKATAVTDNGNESNNDTQPNIDQNVNKQTDHNLVSKRYDEIEDSVNIHSVNDYDESELTGCTGSLHGESDSDSSDSDADEIPDSIDCDASTAVPAFTQDHGLFSHQFNLTIDVPANDSRVQETEDNADIIQGVRDQYRLIKTKYMPRVKKWLQMLNDNNSQSNLFTHLSELKEKLEESIKKCLELELTTSKRRNQDDDDSEEEDFEDVPEKEGYEEDVPEHVQLQAASTSARKSRGRPRNQLSSTTKQLRQTAKSLFLAEHSEESQSSSTADSNNKAGSSTVGFHPGPSSTHFQAIKDKISQNQSYGKSPQPEHVRKLPEEAKSSSSSSGSKSTKSGNQSTSQEFLQEPVNTAASSTVISSTGASADSEKRKDSLLKKAPVVSFGIDLEHWENPDQIKAPVKVQYDDASRFWVPNKEEDTENGASEEVASLTRRAVTYAGKFEPVKWKCRAPLLNGTLCERMDREKCPFHGKIIGRDKTGKATDSVVSDIPNGAIDTESTSGKGKGTGKGKQRAKKRKYPNLTDISESTDNSRTRLEAKIFKRSTMKKVNAALDAITMKKLSEKFGHQFNYSLK